MRSRLATTREGKKKPPEGGFFGIKLKISSKRLPKQQEQRQMQQERLPKQREQRQMQQEQRQMQQQEPKLPKQQPELLLSFHRRPEPEQRSRKPAEATFSSLCPL